MYNYKRRKTTEVRIGAIGIGGNNPIRVQTMANTDTNDIASSVAQAERCIEAGAELVRFTTQGTKEAENLGCIRSQLHSILNIPIVADVHFNPKVAEVAAGLVEKVRINPGNFVKGKSEEYTEEEWTDELNEVKDKLRVLIDICKAHNTAIRIGVNHGSLSPRIMTRYGNTAMGLAMSCMEFIRIMEELEFYNIVLSVKASNTIVMVHAVRMLVEMMDKEDKHYPIHLGVTEAGSDMEGRIKSAAGIGTLLADGIGDTIRVSLSEAPETEIPVAKAIVDYVGMMHKQEYINIEDEKMTTSFARRKTTKLSNIGGCQMPIIVSTSENKGADMSLGNLKHYVLTSYNELMNTPEVLPFLKETSEVTILLVSNSENAVGDMRAAIKIMDDNGINMPVIAVRAYNENSLESLQIKAAIDIGPLLIDGLIDGIYIANAGEGVKEEDIVELGYMILQSTRARISRTEYISCPTCGRTKFDLPEAVKKVKEATKHLVGLKIAVMGCIVNGPGEMADADYGYIGAGAGKVSLYKKDLCVMKNIAEEDAIDALLKIIEVERENTNS